MPTGFLTAIPLFGLAPFLAALGELPAFLAPTAAFGASFFAPGALGLRVLAAGAPFTGASVFFPGPLADAYGASPPLVAVPNPEV